MTESLFLINPRRKRRRGMPAGLKRYWASRRRRKNPARAHRRKRRRNPLAALANPRVSRRRRRNPRVHGYTRRRSRKRNPIFRRRRHRRHNPFSVGGIKGVLIPAAIGAGGAIVLDIAYGYLSPSLPSALTTGYMPAAVQLAGAVGIGLLAGKMMGRQAGMYAGIGAATVVLVGVLTPMLSGILPSTVPLAGLGNAVDYRPYRKVGAYMRGPAGAAGVGRLGFYSPAPTIQVPGRGMGAYMRGNSPGMPAALSDLSGSGYNWQSDGM